MKTAPENVRPWLQLRSVPGIGNLIFHRLITRFGEPEAVFGASRDALLAVEGITPRIVAAIRQASRVDACDREMEKARRMKCHIITQADSRYPSLLRQIPDPPPYLYVLGETADWPATVAMVGSRHATPYGLSTTRRLSSDLARQGITLVSGLARGIDTAAHEGALQGGGPTVAVLGSGLANIYPRENTALSRRIAARGAVVSELPLDAGPDPHHFPQRNRIISGMSLGTVVVEATRRSGSLITARMALEQNREIFAVPGSVTSFKSMGTHALIKEGAKLVTHVGDILEELPPTLPQATFSPEEEPSAPPIAASLTGSAKTVFEALSPYPIHVDELTRQLDIDSGRLAGILLTLELQGLVRQEPGKLFRLAESAARPQPESIRS
ncbi:MAG TPA: DNA-processing protein DprA [Desulfosarcina sp.]|nr:DNA-processing protein DprA [Desulfosarcina sp.]